MSSHRKPRSDAKLMNLPREEQEALYQLTLKVGETEPLGVVDLAGEVALRHGFTVSADTVSRWLRWYAVRRDFEQTQDLVERVQEQMRQDNPELSAEQLHAVGQRIFTTRAVAQDDVETWVALGHLQAKRDALAAEREKFKAGLKNKVEAGLDAISEQIGQNAAARRLFDQLMKEIAEA